MGEDGDSIYELALNCSRRRLPSNLFLNLYNELFNEKYGSVINSGEEQDANNKQTDIYEELSSCFLRLLAIERNGLVADYVVEVLFVNYNTELAKNLLPKLYSIEKLTQLIPFFSKASAFFLRLTDKLVTDQICNDLKDVIIPCVVRTRFDSVDPQLVVAVAKFIRNILKLTSQPIIISDAGVGESMRALLACLGKVNSLLYKRFSVDLDSSLKFDGSASTLPQDDHRSIASPTVTSPRFMDSPLNNVKSSRPAVQHSSNHQTIKLARYCKNLWLNNKIMSWSTNDSDFVAKYGAIEPDILKKAQPSHQNTEAVVMDLIETSFTSFAQFVSNKQYHQPNSDFNLLERQWTTFITKQLPLFILQHANNAPHVVTNALENIDHKVIKALKSYASDKDDVKNRGEDLFDDVPNKNMDIRHDFLKNLIIIGLQPPSILNDYLREDQVADVMSLPTNDAVVVKNAQGVKELVDKFPSFIKDKIEELDIESMFDVTNGPMGNADNGIIQIMKKFETLAATKQSVLAEVFYDLFSESAKSFNCKTLSKVCCLMSFDMSHSLTTIFAFVSPLKFMESATAFIDEIWENSMKKTSNGDSDETDFEPNTEFICFTYVLAFVIQVVKAFDISLVDAVSSSHNISATDSFTIKFIAKLGDIPPNLQLNSDQDPSEVLERWIRDLFVNGSISDSLMRTADVKDLAFLIPYIFKQSVSSVEAGLIRDISGLVGGFEYFLQPFLIVGLIGIFFWAEHYLTTLRTRVISKGVLDPIFDMLSSLIHPSTLNDESRPLHAIILRLNTVQLLRTARALRTRSRSNYGIYSSDSEGDPKLEVIISHLEQVARAGTFYNVDTSVLNSEVGFQRKEIGRTPFAITLENSVNSILNNQVNSFWNLHSSTYYNIDYLFALIDIFSPERFLEEVLSALQLKGADTLASNPRSKESDGHSLLYLDYVFYFLVTHDIGKVNNKEDLIQYMESSTESDLIFKKPSGDPKPNPKVEQPSDEDFDMLFGEDTSMPGNDTETNAYDFRPSDMMLPINPSFLNSSFAAVLHCSLLELKSTLKPEFMEKTDLEQLTHFHEKYVEILKSNAI